jgi:methylenetetrahydrofolate reductase (NADPH)
MAMTISVEFFPPKDEQGEERLWEAMGKLQGLKLDFISVTYGAGGSTRDRTIKITKAIKNHTGINTVAHLTCVGSTKDELIEILNEFKSSGINSILALRGDPVGGPLSEWISTPNGLEHADELVALASKVGGFEIGVAAFPDGHPASNGNFEKDLEVLLKKESLGATFATTQFFFDSVKYFELRDALTKNGSKLRLIPGVLPITNLKQLSRMAELGGTPIPEKVSKSFENLDDADSIRERGIEIASELCEELIKVGVPGIHFYTMNAAESTLKIGKNLGLIK